MKTLRIKAVAAILLLIVTLTACFGTGKVTMDENGVASWEPVKNAVEYECNIVDSNYTVIETRYTRETSIRVPKGYSVHVCPITAKGERLNIMVSDYYGIDDGAVLDGDAHSYVDLSYTLKKDALQSYELLSNIDYSTVQTGADGSVSFEAAAPNGGVMRFVGTGVTVTEGELCFAPGGRISALDAIGRICSVAPLVSDPGDGGNFIRFTGGYTFTDAVSVASAQELFYIWGFVNNTHEFLDRTEDGTGVPISHMDFQPNFIAIGADEENPNAFALSELVIFYDESTYNTGIRLMALEQGFYGTYLEGELYNPTKERYDSQAKIYDFYLLVIPDVADERERFLPNPMTDEMTPRSLLDFDQNRYTIGDLKDSSGNVLDKTNARMTVGSTLEVTVGKYTMDIMVPVAEQYTGAQTLHQLVPYDNNASEGEVINLVVPIVWQDQPENATDALLTELRSDLGRVVDDSGTVTDHSDELTDRFSLSEYYDMASYGKYRITSYVTDWYAAPYSFGGNMEYTDVTGTGFVQELYEWLYRTYPDMDWSRFDGNGDGFFDSVMLVNVGKSSGDEILMGTFGHAVHVSMGYTGEGAGTQQEPRIKNYISMNSSFLGDSTMIHEYGHGFGLVDYYDVTYSGIDALGHYDMQSGNVGDWNPYSKYAVGWIVPQVVQGLEAGESADITIGSFARTGDAIVIPSAGTEHDGPFGEYLLIDLFTPEALNQYDAPAFGLQDAVGVRMYHVNSRMEKRLIVGTDGVEYPIGTVHYANAYHQQGKYLLELLQAGGDNTFTDITNLRTDLTAEDLFAPGDVFTAEAYDEFLTDGRMDDGSEFGYRIKVVSIDQNPAGEYTAVIRITRQ